MRLAFRTRSTLVALLIMMSGCAHHAAQPQGRTLPSGGQPEPTVGPSTTVSIDIQAPIQKVFAYAVAEDVLTKVLKRFGPLPPVIGTRILHGPWERVGADRIVLLDGGGTLHERITRFERPTYFAYRLDHFDDTPLVSLARVAAGSWIFTDLGSTTHLDWTYSFAPSAVPMTPATLLFVNTVYRGYMHQALALMKAQIEGAP